MPPNYMLNATEQNKPLLQFQARRNRQFSSVEHQQLTRELYLASSLSSPTHSSYYWVQLVGLVSILYWQMMTMTMTMIYPHSSTLQTSSVNQKTKFASTVQIKRLMFYCYIPVTPEVSLRTSPVGRV